MGKKNKQKYLKETTKSLDDTINTVGVGNVSQGPLQSGKLHNVVYYTLGVSGESRHVRFIIFKLPAYLGANQLNAS